MKEANTIIVGASISGLASAACLQKHGIEYMIIEKTNSVGTPWRNHYRRLHLHTNKRISNLPFKKFARTIPRYPSRQLVVDYLDDYQKEHMINPIFNTEAARIVKGPGGWMTETNNGVFKSKYVIIATGAFAKPKAVMVGNREPATTPSEEMITFGFKSNKFRAVTLA